MGFWWNRSVLSLSEEKGNTKRSLYFSIITKNMPYPLSHTTRWITGGTCEKVAWTRHVWDPLHCLRFGMAAHRPTLNMCCWLPAQSTGGSLIDLSESWGNRFFLGAQGMPNNSSKFVTEEKKVLVCTVWVCVWKVLCELCYTNLTGWMLH